MATELLLVSGTYDVIIIVFFSTAWPETWSNWEKECRAAGVGTAWKSIRDRFDVRLYGIGIASQDYLDSILNETKHSICANIHTYVWERTWCRDWRTYVGLEEEARLADGAMA